MNEATRKLHNLGSRKVGRRRFLLLGTGTAIVAAAHPMASAMSKLGTGKDDPGYFGTVESVLGGSTVQLRVRDSGEVFDVTLSDAAVERAGGLPAVGQWITAFGTREANSIADAEFILVSEFLDSVPVSDLKSRRFRFTSRSKTMENVSGRPTTVSAETLSGSSQDALAIRTGNGKYEIVAAGNHPGQRV